MKDPLFGKLFQKKKRPTRAKNIIIIKTNLNNIKNIKSKFGKEADIFTKNDKIWIRSNKKSGLRFQVKLKGEDIYFLQKNFDRKNLDKYLATFEQVKAEEEEEEEKMFRALFE